MPALQSALTSCCPHAKLLLSSSSSGIKIYGAQLPHNSRAVAAQVHGSLRRQKQKTLWPRLSGPCCQPCCAQRTQLVRQLQRHAPVRCNLVYCVVFAASRVGYNAGCNHPASYLWGGCSQGAAWFIQMCQNQPQGMQISCLDVACKACRLASLEASGQRQCLAQNMQTPQSQQGGKSAGAGEAVQHPQHVGRAQGVPQGHHRAVAAGHAGRDLP